MAGLGKGFDVLMPTEFDQSLLLDSNERIHKLFVSGIHPNPDQPRRHFDEQNLLELAESLKRFGILQPLVVSPNIDGSYRIIAGERRWRAAKLAGIEKVPAIVRERKELEELEISLVENVQRVDLSPIEQAISVERLHQQFNLSYREIAERLGKAETTLSNIVRLLQLPLSARKALQDQAISEGHARAILALKGKLEVQDELLAHILKDGWSVRQAEQFVVGHKKGVTSEKAVTNRMAAETPETKRISERIHAPVSIKRTARGGRLELHFKTDDELAKLIELLDKLK